MLLVAQISLELFTAIQTDKPIHFVYDLIDDRIHVIYLFRINHQFVAVDRLCSSTSFFKWIFLLYIAEDWINILLCVLFWQPILMFRNSGCHDGQAFWVNSRTVLHGSMFLQAVFAVEAFTAVRTVKATFRTSRLMRAKLHVFVLVGRFTMALEKLQSFISATADWAAMFGTSVKRMHIGAVCRKTISLIESVRKML